MARGDPPLPRRRRLPLRRLNRRGLAEEPCVRCRVAASLRPPRRGLRGRVP